MVSEQTFLQNLPLIEKIIRVVCVRRGLRGEEADDFSGHVRLKMIEVDYAILRKFRGQSSLKTYLVTVIQRLAIDYQIARSGKWRPSIHAQRMGDTAVQMETLLYRDQMPLDEAIQVLLRNRKAPETEKELREIALRLPSRSWSRPRQVDETEMKNASAPDDLFSALRLEKPELVERLQSAVKQTLESLDPDDRLLLKLRFESDLQVSEISRTLGIDQKRLYRRLESGLQKLKRNLELNGISVADVMPHISVLGASLDVWGERKR